MIIKPFLKFKRKVFKQILPNILKMRCVDKATAWLVTLIGLVLVFAVLGLNLDKIFFYRFSAWIISLCVFIIGILQIKKAYGSKYR